MEARSQVISMKIVGIHAVDAPEPCHLFEVEFSAPPKDSDWYAVTQANDSQPQKNWQVPYDEHPLDRDETRWAFFFHYLDLSKPMLTPDGPVVLPQVTPLPGHLKHIKYDEP